ncbi:hypothetical protein L3X38_003527 [Prunus dulcis]|uniref:Aminotransferase-like plant mobile domain-containing protein n=1 Tax=Prunus dulcis TaxID=3755 RepID=A0AAD4ZM87_PRUDU|nr:hypothetical protein L3X38_003527 [Prunus dulcis]
MAQIFGFKPHGRPVDAVGDYHRRKNQEKLAKPFTISPSIIDQNFSFSNFLKKFSTQRDRDQQHMLFLLYWLNSYVCSKGQNCFPDDFSVFKTLSQTLLLYALATACFPAKSLLRVSKPSSSSSIA